MDWNAATNEKTRNHWFYICFTAGQYVRLFFLAPCPSSGLIINGTKDRIAPPEDTEILVEKLHEQKGITITHTQLDGAGHFYEEPFMAPMIEHVTTYVKRRLTENTR